MKLDFELEFTQSARTELKSLPPNTQGRLVRRLRDLARVTSLRSHVSETESQGKVDVSGAEATCTYDFVGRILRVTAVTAT